jgi:cell division protein FtsB
VASAPSNKRNPNARRSWMQILAGGLYANRRKAATLGVAALASVMGYGVVFGHNGLTVFAHKREEARDLQRQMLGLQRENDRLRGHVDRLQSDPGAIEHQAREELHYTRPGEVIYTLPTAPGSEHAPAAGVAAPVQP